MIIENIFVFALALVAGGNVALGWTIYALRRETRALASSLDTTKVYFERRYARAGELLEEHSSKMRELQASSPVALGARVEELADAVERLRMTHQRFAGRVSQFIGAEGAIRSSEPGRTLDRDALRREHAAAIMPAGTKRG